MNKKIVLALLSLLLLPVVALAVNDPNPNASGSNIMSLEQLIETVLEKLWIIFAAFAVIMFVWAGIKFMTAQGAPDKVNEARMMFMWGVVGVVVGIIAYTIISIVGSFVES